MLEMFFLRHSVSEALYKLVSTTRTPKRLQEILLDYDQSNVLLVHIIFFCILLKAFLFLSACIKDPGV